MTGYFVPFELDVTTTATTVEVSNYIASGNYDPDPVAVRPTAQGAGPWSARGTLIRSDVFGAPLASRRHYRYRKQTWKSIGGGGP